LPVPPATVDVTMAEYRFLFEPPTDRGRTVFRLHNRGALGHDLVVVPLTDEVPPIDQQLRGEERLVVATLASIPVRPPGGTGTFALDLEPGRYAFICFVTDPDGQQHAQKGMSAEFRVR
jgi:hypothetical protein